MFKKILLLLILVVMQSTVAVQIDDIPVQLQTVHNKRDELFTEIHKQPIEISTGQLKTAGNRFNFQVAETLKNVKTSKPEQVNIKLKAAKEYFFKVPTDNTKLLRIAYLINNGLLEIALTRYLMGPNIDKPDYRFIVIDLNELAAKKQAALESVQIKVIIDGPKMEASSIEAIPVFKQDNRTPQATPAHPAAYTQPQASARS